jgi:TRAP-type C4-dicarboxylate transport system substrate-binding protein
MTIAMITARLTLLAGLAVVGSAASVEAQTLKLAVNVPATHSLVRLGFEPWLNCVKSEGKGAVDILFFPGGQLGSATASLDVVNKGLAELTMLVPSVLSDKMPLNGIAMLPGMGDTATELTTAFRKVVDGGGPLADEYTANKIKLLWISMLPPYQLVSRSGPLRTAEELRNRKIRVAGGLMGLTVRSVGAVPVDIPASDAYMAVQQGTVDGVVFALSSVNSYRLQEVVKAVSNNGSFGSSPANLAIDLATWEKLSPTGKKIMTDCSAKVEQSVNAALDAENEDLKKKFAAAGVTVYSFTPEAKADLAKRMEAVSKEYITRIAARGAKSQEVYDAFRKALTR